MSDEKKQAPKWFEDLSKQRQIIGTEKYGDDYLKKSQTRDMLEEYSDADNILRLQMKKIFLKIKERYKVDDKDYKALELNKLEYRRLCIELHEMNIDCALKVKEIEELLAKVHLDDIDEENINRPYFDYRVEE